MTEQFQLPQTLYGRGQEVLTNSDRISPDGGKHQLDLTSIMKAVQALTRETMLDQLLSKLMTLLIENAGAERGFLILETNQQLRIEAEGTSDSDSIKVLQSIPIDEDPVEDNINSTSNGNSNSTSNNIANDNINSTSSNPVNNTANNTANQPLSTTIIHYVAQTLSGIVIGDASHDQRFERDRHIKQHKPKSVLCTPLINQNRLTGIVYLENNSTADAFNHDHLEVIQLLSDQAAISIDNARLYTELDVRVQQQAAELVETNQQLEREVLERKRSEKMLRLIVEGTAAVTGKDFFKSLVYSLAQVLEVRYAFVTECDRTSSLHLRTIACWHDHAFIENFEYDIRGTACEQVVNSKGIQCYPAQLQSLFPEDDSLPEMDAQSYAGIALLDSAGNLLGHLAVLDDKPIEEIARNLTLLEIFAARAAAEIERKQSEEVIRISQEKFSKAFRSSPSGITITTLKEGRFIEANDSFLRMVGCSHEDVIGRSSLELDLWVKASDRDHITQLLEQQGAASNVEVELRHKSGDTFLALMSAEIIDLEDEPCLLAVTTDITVLKQAAKALERLAELGELASIIVHEVRNPLTTMLMGLNAFKRLNLSERFQEYLALSLDEAERLQRLLNQILLYAKPQTLNRSELELNHFIGETLNTLRDIPAAATKHLQLMSDFNPALISADRDKLKQVLINLLMNACEASKDGATITVSLQEAGSHQVQIQVHNAGDAISPEILSQLTKPFFTTKANGNGLGLAIVKRIVESHRGELHIESSADVGTTVTVKLPLK